MSLKELSRVYPVLRELSKNKLHHTIVNPLPSCCYVSRNFGMYSLQVPVKRFEATVRNPNILSLICMRSRTRLNSSKSNNVSSEGGSKCVTDPNAPSESKPPEEKISLYQKMKVLYRDYWYILVPAHFVTSTIWFGSFYYLAQSGVDVIALLQTLGFSESITSKLEGGNPAYTNLALAYGLYKIATPARYTVTLGTTTFSINKLKELGYIKPIPPKEKLVEIYEEKKEQLIEKKDLLKEKYQGNKALIQERYQDNKAFIQEKYSAEKCKRHLRSSRDKILNTWRRKPSRQKANGNAPDKAKVNGSRKKNNTDNDVKTNGS